MAEMRLGIKIGLGRDTLTISLYQDDALVGEVNATADEVDLLIRTFANRRRLLKPEVSVIPFDGSLSAEVDPIWAISSQAESSEKELVIRNTGLGWISFMLSAQAAQQLGFALINSVPLRIMTPDPYARPS